MKKLLLVLAIGGLVVSCGESKKEEKKDGFEMNRAKKEVKAETTSEAVPVDMANDGVGSFNNIEFSSDIDAEMAAVGEAKFNAICTACHMAEQRMIGPALKGPCSCTARYPPFYNTAGSLTNTPTRDSYARWGLRRAACCHPHPKYS